MTRRWLSLLVVSCLACTSEAEPASETDASSTSASDSESGASETSTETSESETSEGETGEPEPSGPNCEDGTLEPGDHLFNIQHDGELRAFTVHVPPGYTGTELTPLVLNFHGLGSNGTQQQFFSYMDPLADEEGFIVVYPEGLVKGDGNWAWNAGVCCADDLTIDDVGFVRAMLDELDTMGCVDPKRRFATGMSNGGFMSYLLACEAADLIAAVAPVAGALGIPLAECEPARPVPVWQIHGTIDGLVPFDAALDSAEAWAGLNDCGVQSSTTFENGVVSCEAWDCPAGAEVEFCTAEGVDHCWPGQAFCIDPPTTLDIDSTATIWAFFEAHPLN